MRTYYVFVKENFYRPVKVESVSVEEAVEAVAAGSGEPLTVEHHSTSHWTEWLVEDPTGTRYYHAVGEGYLPIWW